MKGTVGDYLGAGIYSIPEAAWLTGVSSPRIRRWLHGYASRSGSLVKHSVGVWQGHLPPMGRASALSFQDLIEVRFVDAFIEAGVRWPVLREAHTRAGELVQSTHPFCTNRFKTEGRHIFLDIAEYPSASGLVEVCKSQHYFDGMLRPILKDLEFARGEIQRWWPLGRSRHVVLDPSRSFGQPIVENEGVPTAVLARAVKSNLNEADVCKWFEISQSSLADALAFERRYAA